MLAEVCHPLFLVPIAMIMGYFIRKGRAAVYVLNKQVEEITDGAISSKAMGMGLSLGVAVSLGLAMVRVLTGISILWFLIRDTIAGNRFLCRRSIQRSFDSGGVASGPMTAAFMLPMAQGSLLRSWRKHCHRCLRCGRDGCHDTAYHDPGHGAGFENKSEARSAGRNVRSSWTVEGIRSV